MNKILTGALAALTLGGSMAATAVPASAAPYHGYYHGGYGYRGGWHGGYGYGVAAAGILGLAAGAAIADGYGPRYYYGGPPCRFEMRWNPNWGGYDRVRVCY